MGTPDRAGAAYGLLLGTVAQRRPVGRCGARVTTLPPGGACDHQRAATARTTTDAPVATVSAIALITSTSVESGGSWGSPIQRSVTRRPPSQIGPTIRRA